MVKSTSCSSRVLSSVPSIHVVAHYSPMRSDALVCADVREDKITHIHKVNLKIAQVPWNLCGYYGFFE